MTERCETCRAPVVREGGRVRFDSSRYHMDAVKKLSEISALRGVVEELTAEVSNKEILLRELRIALDTWVRTYAPEHCKPEHVEAAHQLLSDNGGTLVSIGS